MNELRYTFGLLTKSRTDTGARRDSRGGNSQASRYSVRSTVNSFCSSFRLPPLLAFAVIAHASTVGNVSKPYALA